MTGEPPVSGTIIIAAHNEEAVIGRTLDALADVRSVGDLRVIVVCNGCTDNTAQVAGARSGVIVVDLDVASKIAALREGDRHAAAGPRIYLDADIVLTDRAARDVVATLSRGALAARPRHRFDTSRSSAIVTSWYRIRERLPSISSALWGAGCYALSVDGRARFDEFPDVVSDDLFIDSLFTADDVVILDTDPVVVTAPRRLKGLISILRRSYRTQSEVVDGEGSAAGLSQGQRGQVADIRALLRREPSRIGDVVVYVAVVAYARMRARRARGPQAWERDASSRE